MHRWKRTLRVAVVVTSAVAAAAVVVGVPTASSAEPVRAAPTEEHCVVRVIGQAGDGELRTTEPVCAPTRAVALQRAIRQIGVQEADWAIGIHFDGPAYTGSSFTVVGADCTGGWLNLNASWINRVSSTMHGCPRIRHFDGYNLATPSETTLSPGANLITNNNKTNSIQYLP
jgi:hypothetical protein